MDRHILVNYCFVTRNTMDEPQNNYGEKKSNKSTCCRFPVLKFTLMTESRLLVAWEPETLRKNVRVRLLRETQGNFGVRE